MSSDLKRYMPQPSACNNNNNLYTDPQTYRSQLNWLGLYLMFRETKQWMEKNRYVQTYLYIVSICKQEDDEE